MKNDVTKKFFELMQEYQNLGRIGGFQDCDLNKAPKSNAIYMVRTYSAGVFFGEIVERNGKEVEMANARRVYYWDGAATLSQLATDGTSKPENCKFPCAVEKVFLTEAIEIIPMTEKAIKSLNSVEIWSA